MKTITSISIDTELKREAQQIIPNLSGEFEEFLKMRLAQAKGDSKQMNLLILEKQLQSAEKELQQKSAKVQTLQSQIDLTKKVLKEKELQKLKKEKKVAERLKSCVVCGGQIEGQKFEKAFVNSFGEQLYMHTSCFLNWASDRADKSVEALKRFCEGRTFG